MEKDYNKSQELLQRGKEESNMKMLNDAMNLCPHDYIRDKDLDTPEIEVSKCILCGNFDYKERR